jgi:PAS domain S-box-containing protein
MRVSLRAQFYFVIVPFVAALVALLIAALTPFLAVRGDILQVERDLACLQAAHGFDDAFAGEIRELPDFVVTGLSADEKEWAAAVIDARQNLAAWHRLSVDDDASEQEIVRRVSADHARVLDLGARVLRFRNDGRQTEAAALLSAEVLPLVTAISLRIDQNFIEHQGAISRHIVRIAGGIDYSKFLQLGGMPQGIENLDSHIAEVFDSAAYKRAIETEVRGYRDVVLSNNHLLGAIEADHQRVTRSFAAWRVMVKTYVDAHDTGGRKEIDELRLADDVQRRYLALHGDGEKIIRLVGDGFPEQARELLLRALLENDAIADTMQKYTAHESRVAAENLQYLREETVRVRRMLMAAVVIILLVGLGVPWVFSRRMIEPILSLQQAALRIGSGDLETRIAVPATIELGSLATTFNDMAKELKISRNEDLKKSEERFQLAARATSDMIWDWNIRTDHLWLDQGFRERFVSGDEEFSAVEWFAAIHPADRNAIEQSLVAVITGSQHFWSGEYRLRRLDGTYVQMADRGYIVREADGTAVRMIGAVTDITERRNAEHAIASLHRQKEMILNSVGDGIVGLNAEGKITTVNAAGLAMLACEENDLLGTPVYEVVGGGDAGGSSRQWEDSPIHTTLAEGTLQSSDEELFFRADRSSFPADYVSNAMCDDDGKVIGAVVTFRDITAKHELDRLKSQFVSTVSHELRTPLTSIRGALGLLSGGLLGEVSAKGQRMLDIAVSNTDRLVRLINDILDVERIESRQMEMARVEVDAFDVMERAAESVQSMAEEAGVRLVIQPETATLLGDRDRIIQILTNLLGNAIKFSPRDTTVTLSVACREAECTFRVVDEGRGVPNGKLEMIFERFQQVDASDSRDKGGSGLGLAICRSIVVAHGGRIWAEKNEPAGTVVQFTIPVAVAPAAPEAASASRTLMVCEENDSVMPGMVKMLEGHGFLVLRCAEADVAARVSETQPDAIILDLASKGGHGWQIVEALKSEAETCDVPIVVATMQSPESWRHYAAAVASWVHKPFASDDLFDAVAKACNAPSIVVVEDDADLAQIMTEILKSHGIRTFHAASGREAIQLCRQHEPSLLVLDLVLPDIDGFAVVQSLRESATLRRIPLLVYSGMDVGSADQKRLQLGPTEFLTKSRAGVQEFESHVVRLLHAITAPNAEVSHAA